MAKYQDRFMFYPLPRQKSTWVFHDRIDKIKCLFYGRDLKHAKVIARSIVRGRLTVAS